MIALFAATAILFAADSPAPDAGGPDPVLGFAHSLYQEGDYYRAITEAKRYLYLRGREGAPEATLLIGECYLAGQQWTAAAATLEPLVAAAPPGEVGADASFALADARIGAGDYDLAALEYRRFGDDFPDDPRAALSWLRVAWARMFAADVIATYEPKKGRVAFAAAARDLELVPADSPEKARAVKLAAAARRLATLSLRSPALAGTLSAIIPGTGQMYAGRWKDGIIAQFVNGIFIAGIVESYELGNKVASGILVLFEMGWYSGNIYSAINSAHRANDDDRAGILKEMKKTLYFQVAPLSGSRGPPDGARGLLGARI